MELWTAYDYIVNTVHAFMLRTDQCLYNALVVTLAGKRAEYPGVEEMSREKLLKIRDSLLELAKFIQGEINARDEERTEQEE